MKFTANRRRSLTLWIWLGFATAVALALRLVRLDDRPVHTDEAVNAVIVGDMLAGNGYRYDAHDHHGPAYYYLTERVCRALGVNSLAAMQAWQLRASAALVGASTLLLLGLLAEEATGALAGAALFLALGAPFVFYGRYAIHETLLVLTTLLAIGAGWQFWRSGRMGWAAVAGLGLGLAACTKESALVNTAAIALSLAFCAWHPSTRRLWLERRAPELAPGRMRAGAAVALLVVVALNLAFFSSFGRNPAGLRGSFQAIFFLSNRALMGAGHQKPWWAYLAWLARPDPLSPPWFGWLLITGCFAGAAFGFSRSANAPLARFFAVLAAILFIVHAATPYKTPWLMLSFLTPAVIVAGYGLARALEIIPGRLRAAARVAAALAVAALLAHETNRLCFLYTGDSPNPYCYSPTAPDLNRLAARLDGLAAVSPLGRNMLIQVVATDYWPLPWYLRGFPRVGYWGEMPARLTGDVVVASLDQAEAADAMLGPGWHHEYFGLRADVLILLYTRNKPDRA